jgi:hypothetical protein
MWYTKDGILRKKIHILCPDGIAKDFPMPFNPIHRKDGYVWNSAGKNVENMNEWFTASDAINLYNMVDEPFTEKASFNDKKFYETVYESQRLMDDLVDLELLECLEVLVLLFDFFKGKSLIL